MKKMTLIVTLFVFSTAGIFAQSSSAQTGDFKKSWTTPSEKNPDSKARPAADKFIHIAQLSEAQYPKVLEVYKSFYSQNASQTSVNGRNAKLKSILNKDQWQKAQEAGLVSEKPTK